LFSILLGITSLGIFLQAVTAGAFMSQRGLEGWVDAHDIIASVVTVLALATMICAIIALRKISRAIVIGTVVLFVLTAAQTVIGHLIADSHFRGLIAVHVPLAFVIFGIAVWLPIQSAVLRRRQAD
jgi:hypothetical protein